MTDKMKCCTGNNEKMNEYPEIRQELREYICKEVVPKYAFFDPAHRQDHALAVIDNSMVLYRTAPEDIRSGLDPEILFVAAACHDLGRINGKENHHIDSGKMIRADGHLRRWLSSEQIEIVAEAAEDHRASAKSEPRSIYGKIVAEADRLIDAETIIRWTLQYGMSNYPSLSSEEQVARAMAHLKAKYGAGGYLRLWIPWSGNAVRLDRLQTLLSDDDATRAEVSRIFRALQ